MDTLEHPEPEQLIAYHERRLSPAAADELRAHLAACAGCTTQLLELAALFDGEDDAASEVSREEMEAAWRRQRARLFPKREPLRRARITAASLGLAASLLAAVTLFQWQMITQLRQAQANPPLVNLAPAGSVRQEASAAPELLLAPGTQRAWVILNPAMELQDAFYDVDVVAPDGRVVLPFQDVRRSEANNFRLEIPRGVLAEGDYLIYLLGKNEGRRWINETFALRVRLSPSSAP